MQSSIFLLTLAAASDDFFESRVRPVLMTKCAPCHGSISSASGLRVDSRDALLKGGVRGPAIVASKPESSLLLQAVTHTHATLKMPPGNARLSPAEISSLEDWIRDGAVWPAATNAPIPVSFWSFEPLKPTSGSIDGHVRAALKAKGIAPNPRADPRTLLRRLHADLTGLPPSPEDADAFEKKDVAQIVDRLLASPAFGERWGRHWLMSRVSVRTIFRARLHARIPTRGDFAIG